MKEAHIHLVDWLILDMLIPGDASGRQIQEMLKRRKIREPWDSLSKKLSLLEDETFVDGRYEEHCIGDDCNFNRIYSISANGIKEYVATEFVFQSLAADEADRKTRGA
ncbi:hypothetical protein N9242_07780 [Vicingaceae bacterium]|nr:hypothetical protein [Vicingaceae bacterium]